MRLRSTTWRSYFRKGYRRGLPFTRAVRDARRMSFTCTGSRRIFGRRERWDERPTQRRWLPIFGWSVRRDAESCGPYTIACLTTPITPTWIFGSGVARPRGRYAHRARRNDAHASGRAVQCKTRSYSRHSARPLSRRIRRSDPTGGGSRAAGDFARWALISQSWNAPAVQGARPAH